MNVTEKLAADGIHKARLLTTLRRWANEHPEVQRLNLSYTGNYAIAILADIWTDDAVRVLNQSLTEAISGMFSRERMPDSYVVDMNFSSAPMFQRPGAITILDKTERGLEI